MSQKHNNVLKTNKMLFPKKIEILQNEPQRRAPSRYNIYASFEHTACTCSKCQNIAA